MYAKFFYQVVGDRKEMGKKETKYVLLSNSIVTSDL
jgi:hypothetical protein